MTAGLRDNREVTSDPHTASLLAHAEELQRRDEALAAGIEAVAGLLARADGVRDRAASVLEALSTIPVELARNDEAEREARQRQDSAGREVADAEARADEVARTRRGGEEARAQAQRELTRAREQLADAGAAVGRLAARRQELLDSERALREEAAGLAVAAGAAAAEIGALPRVSASGRERPGTELPALVAWGARVHAALFVVRGGLESERERVVAEASLLGAAVLGEQIAGSSVARVRGRLEAHLQGR